MKVWLNRNTCDSNLAACEGCFGHMVLTGVPDRACVMRYEEDDSDTLTVQLHTENHTTTIVIPPERRDEVAYEGWSQFVPFEIPFRKNEGNEALGK